MRGSSLLLAAGVSALVACGAGDATTEPTATSQSAVVGGVQSGPSEDFSVFLGRAGFKEHICGSALIAPNLVVTAKHCVHEYATNASAVCGPTGEPAPGSEGGYAGDPFPPETVLLFKGADGRNRFVNDDLPDSAGSKLITDGTNKLCIADITFVVLQKAITDVPIGKLRLGKRPQMDEKIAVSGWGRVEDQATTKFRIRRGNIPILSVGAAIVDPQSTASIPPHVFETTAGACTGDSGSPGFLEATGTVLGVVARAKLDPTDPVSPCRSDNVRDYYSTVADFGDVVRDAFKAAGAEPWLEGEAGPGYRAFGAACGANAECAGNLCVGATEKVQGTCNVPCSKPGNTCPDGTACTAKGICETTVTTMPTDDAGGTTPEVDAGTTTPTSDDPEEHASGCSVGGERHDGSSSVWFAIGACFFVAVRRRMTRGRREDES